MFPQSSIKASAVRTLACVLLAPPLPALGGVRHPPAVSCAPPQHTPVPVRVSQSVQPLSIIKQPVRVEQFALQGRRWASRWHLMGGWLHGWRASRLLWEVHREPRTALVFQGAADSRCSPDLPVRREESWGDDLNVYVCRKV